jgi:hypothetical protein
MLDDRPTPVGEHGWDLVLHRQEGAAEVDGECAVEVFDRDLGERYGYVAAAGRVVERCIDPTVSVDRPDD